MQRQRPLIPSAPLSVVFLVFAFALLTAGAVHAVMPYTSATVTRVENKVSYGKVSGGRSITRPAAAQDIVKASDFLLSETDARAELKYDDGTIVRIGQNTVFSFEANTRSMQLKKGTFVFYVPKGSGGATIKTPSITAAITGTLGKVSPNRIAIVEGSIKLIPSGQTVNANQYAEYDPITKTITVFDFDPATAYDGKLLTWNGKIGGLPGEPEVIDNFKFLVVDDVLSAATNMPSSFNVITPPSEPADRQKTKTFVPPPGKPNGNHNPTPY